MRLFKNLDPGVKPIVTKSKRFNLEDQKFIRSEIKKLLDENIIEPSTSPWRAQVLIADDGRHRRTQGGVSGVKPPPLKNGVQPYVHGSK